MDIQTKLKSSHPAVFLRKGIPKICSKFTGEHPCQNVAIKFGQLTEYNMSNICLKNSYKKLGEKIFSDPFLKKSKLGNLWINSWLKKEIPNRNSSKTLLVRTIKNCGDRTKFNLLVIYLFKIDNITLQASKC